MAAERVTIGELKRGDIITFYYQSGHDQRPTVLFLNLFENLVHGVNLNYLSAVQISYLKVILNTKAYELHNIENPKDFYNSVLKDGNLQTAYRTYKPDRMLQLFRIGYKTETLEKDTGLKEKDTTTSVTEEPKTITKPQIPKTIPDKILPNTSTLPDNIFGIDDK